MPDRSIIQATGIEKAYGAHPVLRGVDLRVDRGEIFALLGPNGAGKTTTVNILTTLVKPDAGQATIDGFDLVREPAAVRGAISLTGQHAAVDEFLTGRENLRMMGRLAHLTPSASRARADELLDRFDLTHDGGRRVATYSGGMRRRLDLAISLVAEPPVIFLDEPTTGLDPRSRLTFWTVVRELAAGGTTIFLTTQYLEEADQLADRIAVIDEGTIIAEGTADDLKRGLSGERVELTFPDPASLVSAIGVLRGDATTPAATRGGVDVRTTSEAITVDDLQSDDDRLALSVGAADPVATTRALLDLMDAHDLPIDSIAIIRPSLDDVFLALTGRATNRSRSEEAA